MGVPLGRMSSRLPQRFPVGAKYVVEGFGGGDGHLRVIARYVVLPGGRRINVLADVPRPAAPRTLPFRRSSEAKRSLAKGSSYNGRKKIAAGRGTA